MHELLEREVEIYKRRTPKSAAAHRRAEVRLPLGVASSYRAYEPYPIFIQEGHAGRVTDIDGNEYVDHNLCFGVLLAGHNHPAVVGAIERVLQIGTTFGMPHEMEWELAEEICERYPIDMVRFGSSGTEVTMHACRLARAATARDKILKFEGGYHGLHDTVLVSVKPTAEQVGDAADPIAVPQGLGIPQGTVDNTVIASFNDLDGVERRFQQHRNQIAAVIVEPIMMNVGLCMPQAGFLQGLREITTRNGALLIFDEVKTGAKLAWGGASEYFDVKPDILTLAKAIGGGVPLGAFGATHAVMDLITSHRIYHGGTYNANRIAIAAGLAMFREVLTRDNYAHVTRLNKKLSDGYRKIIAKYDLQAYVVNAGANGALMLLEEEIRDYRDWLRIDQTLWSQYWFGMVNRGIIPQPFWRDEQWTISVQHTDSDIDKHLAAFEDVAPGLALAQEGRSKFADARH